MKTVMTIMVAIFAMGMLNAGEFKPPANWKGSAKGKTDGNPKEANGAKWTLYQVWPDDPSEKKNYHLMVWNGKQWGAKENGFGGQPSWSIDNAGKITFSIRGSWQGNRGARICALVFTAPEKGKYTVSGKVTAKFWKGKEKYLFYINKKEADADEIDIMKRYEVKSADPIELNAKISMDKGDQIIIVPKISAFHTAGGIFITGLTIKK